MEHDEFLSIIKQAATNSFSSEEEINAFVEGFDKEASQMNLFPGMGSTISSVGEFLSHNEALARPLGALGVGLLGALVAKGISSGAGGFNNMQLRSKFEEALKRAMATSKVIKGTDPEKVRDYAETIFRFAPNVAGDSNILSSVLSHVVLGEGMDATIIKNLVDLEGRYKDNTSRGPIVSFKT